MWSVVVVTTKCNVKNYFTQGYRTHKSVMSFKWLIFHRCSLPYLQPYSDETICTKLLVTAQQNITKYSGNFPSKQLIIMWLWHFTLRLFYSLCIHPVQTRISAELKSSHIGYCLEMIITCAWLIIYSMPCLSCLHAGSLRVSKQYSWVPHLGGKFWYDWDFSGMNLRKVIFSSQLRRPHYVASNDDNLRRHCLQAHRETQFTSDICVPILATWSKR